MCRQIFTKYATSDFISLLLSLLSTSSAEESRITVLYTVKSPLYLYNVGWGKLKRFHTELGQRPDCILRRQ